MKSVFQEMNRLFSQGESFVLCTVIAHNGSTPRSSGAKMVVSASSPTIGTVGGGLLEAKVEEAARQVLKEQTALVSDIAFSGSDAATGDMICGGQVKVLIEWWDANSVPLRSIAVSLLASAGSYQPAWLVMPLPEVKKPSGAAQRYALLLPAGVIQGALPDGLELEQVQALRAPRLFKLVGGEVFVDALVVGGTVYIYGCGHVGQSLADFTHKVGFRTVALDDRAEFANRQRFPDADEIILLSSFEDSLAGLAMDADSYIVIVTRGHLHDRTVLAQALRSGAGYIGMIGSKRKINLIYNELRRQGFTDEELERVYAPIGVEISAETPEEIGVSIVAEMIRERAKKTGNR
jgi:xanthine dehydrogenase accessory factor